jgi:hypothetical protein
MCQACRNMPGYADLKHDYALACREARAKNPVPYWQRPVLVWALTPAKLNTECKRLAARITDDRKVVISC